MHKQQEKRGNTTNPPADLLVVLGLELKGGKLLRLENDADGSVCRAIRAGRAADLAIDRRVQLVLLTSSMLRVICAFVGSTVSAATLVANARTSSAWAVSASICFCQ